MEAADYGPARNAYAVHESSSGSCCTGMYRRPKEHITVQKGYKEKDKGKKNYAGAIFRASV